MCFTIPWLLQALIWLVVVGGVVAVIMIILPIVLGWFSQPWRAHCHGDEVFEHEDEGEEGDRACGADAEHRPGCLSPAARCLITEV
jgi:hypothetical protein